MSARKSRPSIKTVVIAVQLTFWSGRDILFGISRYARKNCHWRIQILSSPYGIRSCDLEKWARPGIDGLIVDSVPYAPVLSVLRKTNIPLVLIGDPEQCPMPNRKSLAYVRYDDLGVGQLGARTLLSLGRFNSFGFVPSRHDPESYCSSLREQGFREAIQKAGHAVHVFPSDPNVDMNTDLLRLSQWLEDLPKPAAVMGVFDQRAVTIIDAAGKINLDIPKDLVVLGVDNDELFCDFSSPPLSSLMPDHVLEGEICARTLDNLIKQRVIDPARPVLATGCRLVERLSTKALPPGEHLARRARDFIKQEAVHGISVSDVANFLGVSRRLADLRFRQFSGMSIHAALQERRLGDLKRRLRDTSIPIGQVIAACGFHDPSHAMRLFKRTTGHTMRTWRNSGTVP